MLEVSLIFIEAKGKVVYQPSLFPLPLLYVAQLAERHLIEVSHAWAPIP